MADSNNNPWLGLQSYQENQIIYGRNIEINDLAQRVLNDVDTVLYGKSGIGKTSIINAGVLPIARQKGYLPIVIRLDHSNTKSYVTQIQEILCKNVTIKEVVPAKDASKELLWEFFHRNTFEKEKRRTNLLLIFDQFEEIFTLQNNPTTRLDFFKELCDVLNDIMPTELIDNPTDKQAKAAKATSTQVEGFASMADIFSEGTSATVSDESIYVQDNDIHFVFTLREDFLSDFEYFTTKIPSLKQHRFGLRPLNEEQAAEIITKPRPGLVSMDVAHLIIESVTGRNDFSLGDEPEIEVDAAVLSLFLSRIYKKLNEEDDIISAQIVNQFGADIIKDFYLESIESLTESEVNLLEDRLLTTNGRRNNVSYSDFCNSIDSTKVDDLIKEKKLLRTFNYGNDLRLEFIHDILCPVVKERKEKRNQLRQQEEERKRQEEEKQKAIAEEQKKRQEIEAKAAIDRRNSRKRTLGLVAFIILLVGLATTYYFAFQHVFSSYYASYELRKGYPVGIDELSDEDQSHTALYYKLSHVGFLNSDVITEIEVMSSNKFLPKSPRVKVYEVGEYEGDSNSKRKEFNDILSSVKKIRFTRDSQSRASKEEYLDEKNNVVLTLNYFYTNDREAWIRFIAGNGQSLKISDDGAEQVKVSWDDNNRVVGEMFYDHDGVCVSVDKGINGYLWDYTVPNIICKYILNEYNQPTNMSYNTIYTYTSNDSTVVSYAKSQNINDHTSAFISNAAIGPLGYHKQITINNKISLFSLNGERAEMKVDYDKNGNVKSTSISGTINKEYPAKHKYEYKDGLLTLKEIIGINDIPFSNRADSIYKWTWTYAADGSLTEENRTNVHNILVYGYSIKKSDGQTIRVFMNLKKNPSYVKRIDTQKGNCIVSEFFDKNDKPLNGRWFDMDDDSIQIFQKIVEKTDKNLITKSFYRYEGTTNKYIPLETTTNEYGNLTSYYKKCVVYGSNKDIQKYQVFDKKNKLIKSMMYFFQNGDKIGRAVCGIDNTPVRCPNWEEEGYAYYKMYFTTINGDRYKSIQAVNEWEDICYFYNIFEKTFYNTSYINYKGLRTMNGYPIDYDYKQMMLVGAKNISNEYIPYLHILSKASVLYKRGLHDGDRIVKFASWKRGLPEKTLANEWNKNSIRNVTIKVLRPLANKKYKAIEVSLSSCSNLKELAEYHWLALTNEELKIINQ